MDPRDKSVNTPCDEDAPASATIAHGKYPEPSSVIAIGAVLAAMVLVVLNTTMATVALPTLADALQITPATATWILTAYQAALLMALLPCAALGERLGYRRVFGWGVWLFTGASVLCALSPSLPCLIAGRFLQGLGGAAVMALGMALIRRVVTHRRLGVAIGWNALAVALSSAAGPVIGAGLLTIAQWPWLFAAPLPLAAAVLFASRALPDSSCTSHALDFISMLLNAGAFAALIAAAGVATSSPAAAGALLAGAFIQLWLLVRREKTKAAPLLPLDLLACRSLRLSVISSILCFAGQTAGMVALSFFLQHTLGLGAWMAGLLLVPWPLMVALTAPFAGRLADRAPTTGQCLLGGLCLAIGLGAASQVQTTGSALLLVPLSLLCGFGFSLFNVANNRNLFMTVPLQRSGAMGGLQGTARLIGQSIGGVIISALFTLYSHESAPQIGLGIGAMLALASALSSLQRGGSLSTGKHEHTQSNR